MRSSLLAIVLVSLVTTPLVSQPAQLAHSADPPRFAVELEGGAAWQSRNDARIPNDDASTRFSLRRLVGGGPWAAGRVYVTWHANARHSVRALAAPLTVTGTGVPAAPVRFQGGLFAAARPVDATYTFNSYRLTYRYRWRETPRTSAWLGFTAKVRDATVALEQDGMARRKDDVGFVPLLHLAGDRRLGTRWRVGLDADALAGGPGRAIDAALRLGYDVNRRMAVHAGYRTVEGGADVDEVYNFAWLHYAVASVTVRW